MIPNKILNKKSKKRRNSNDISSDEEYERGRTGKLRKHSKAIKQKQGEQKKKSQKNIVDKYGLGISSQSDSNRSIQQQRRKSHFISIQIFNADKIFAQILNKANKQPDFLIMLKNLLSGCSRSLTDKKNMFKKKWKQLRNSNCSQEEYLSRQAELKRAQLEQIHQMQKDIMVKLSYANIKGFQTRHSLIQNYKKQMGLNNKPQQKDEQNQIQYEIEDDTWQKYYDEQRRLLDLLMKENDFVSQDYIPSNLIKTYSEPVKDKQQNLKDQIFQDNQIGVKFNNLQTQQNPQSTQFLFCKQFKEINYDRVFSNGMNSFKPQQTQKYFIQPKAMGLLLQTKSDQIYTNQKFQRQKYKKYSELLKQIYDNPKKYDDSEIISSLLQIGAYILNSVHYYQKFKLKCQLLHPLDLQLVIERIKNYKRNNMQDQRLQRMQVQMQHIIYQQSRQRQRSKIEQQI